MAIKRLVFSSLTATGFTYTAVGGIRFYDPAGVLIGSGALVSSASTQGVFANFTVTSTSTYNATYYYVGNAFDEAKPQSGSYTGNWYWLTDVDNQTLEVTFDVAVAEIGRIEFVPTPDSGAQADRGIDAAFSLAAYDESNVLIHEYTVTPDTSSRNLLNTLSTPELTNLVMLSLAGGLSFSSGMTTQYDAATKLMVARTSVEVVTVPISEVRASRLSVEVITASSYNPQVYTIALAGEITPQAEFTEIRRQRSDAALSPTGVLEISPSIKSRQSGSGTVGTEGELGISPHVQHEGGVAFSRDLMIASTSGTVRVDGSLHPAGAMSHNTLIGRGGQLSVSGALSTQSVVARINAGGSIGFMSALGSYHHYLREAPLVGGLGFGGDLVGGVRRDRQIDSGVSFSGVVAGQRLFGRLGYLTFGGTLQRTSSLTMSNNAQGAVWFRGQAARVVRHSFQSGLDFEGYFPSAFHYSDAQLSFGSTLDWTQLKRFEADLTFGIWVEKPLNRKVFADVEGRFWFNSDLPQHFSLLTTELGFSGELQQVATINGVPFVNREGVLALSGHLDPKMLASLAADLGWTGDLDYLIHRFLSRDLGFSSLLIPSHWINTKFTRKSGAPGDWDDWTVEQEDQRPTLPYKGFREP